MQFSYTAVDKEGKKITATEEAVDEESLVIRLQAKGMVVVHVTALEATAAKPKETIAIGAGKNKFTHKRIKLNDLVVFSRQLATMLDSGVTLLKSLEVILQQVDSSNLYGCLSSVKRDLEQGSSLSASLSKHPKVFNQFWLSLVEVGEASGTLPVILEKLAFYLEEKAAFQSKVITAMIYPIVLFIVCIGAISFFALKIIPVFTGIFKGFGVKLPFLTQMILAVFEFIRQKFLLLLFSLIGIIYFMKWYSKTSTGKKQIETILFKLPVFGNFYKIFIIERFISQMSILVESGVPILYALEICQRMIGNKTVEEVIGFVKNNVREGKLFAEPMQKSGFFTPMVVQMVLIGEETGELSKMLKKVAFFYQNYVSAFLSRFTSLFEPIMIVIMGFLVGTIVISMFLPIFSIATLSGTSVH